MVKILKDKVIFSRDIWEELKKNTNYSELIEDIEDRIELEEAIEHHKKNGGKFTEFRKYDNQRLKSKKL